MDIASLFMFCLISLVIGAVLTLLAQYYIYLRFCYMPSLTREQKKMNEKYALPKNVREHALKLDMESKSPLVAVNFIIQFLFHELKHTDRVRKWCYRKLTLELEELVTKTTAGKLFQKLTLKHMELGDQLPELKSLHVHDVKIHETENRIENLDLLMDVNYKGNFWIAVDADMVLGRKASVTLKVTRLSGPARLQFTRQPYSHWSLSFLGDPHLEMEIESKFQGRQMQSNISNLIFSQIRRAIRRKHTLPKYKIRYKPFFHKVEEEYDSDFLLNGNLTVKVCELNRILIPNEQITNIYCTLTMSPEAWVEIIQKDVGFTIVSIDVEIRKAKNQQIGIVFKQMQGYVEVEAILPNTPAVKSNLKPGDILISVEHTEVNAIQQVAKLVRNINQTTFVVRIKRVLKILIRDDTTTEEVLVNEEIPEPKGVQSPNIRLSEDISVQTSGSNLSIGSRSLRTNSSEESSVSETPTHSPKKKRFIPKAFKKSILKDSNETNDNTSSNTSLLKAFKRKESNESTDIPPLNPIKKVGSAASLNTTTIESELIPECHQHTTADHHIRQLMDINDETSFKLDPNHKFLNICVYGRLGESSRLLGFLNIPLNALIAEYGSMTLTEIVKLFNVSPSTEQDVKSHYLSSFSGFNGKLCYGQILLAFTWEGNTSELDVSRKSSKVKVFPTKSEEFDKSDTGTSKAHVFLRTHFQQATQCDFCGKKIWLKDAVQCRECTMTCHKKCVAKCQEATVCGPADYATASYPSIQPELSVTEASSQNVEVQDQSEIISNADERDAALEQSSSQSWSGLLVEGLKRVNSAHNLSIPVIPSSASLNSKSLPPSPQHSPKKQYPDNGEHSSFDVVTQILESIPLTTDQLTTEQIDSITEPILSINSSKDVMTIAKNASKDLFKHLDAQERVDKINELLTKLRLALDSETAIHAQLLFERKPSEDLTTKSTTLESSPSSVIEVSSQISIAESSQRSLNLRRSEERVQALSVIMLYLCTGLQHAQGVASQ